MRSPGAVRLKRLKNICGADRGKTAYGCWRISRTMASGSASWRARHQRAGIINMSWR